MQENFMQPAMQPFVKLAEANMELLTKSFTSPDAFAQLTQGLIKNYTEFMTELGKVTMAVLSQGQAAMLHGAQEGSENVVDVTEARGRRSRHAA